MSTQLKTQTLWASGVALPMVEALLDASKALEWWVSEHPNVTVVGYRASLERMGPDKGLCREVTVEYYGDRSY